MRRYVFDSNAVDPIADLPGAYEVVRAAVDEKHIEILFPHITLDELSQVKELERRQLLLVVLVSLARLVFSGGFVLDQSRLDQARLSEDTVTFDVLKSGKDRNTRDALIGVTAEFEQCTLVTRDDELSRNAHANGGDVVAPLDFLAQLGFADSAEQAPSPPWMR
ncbi:PIN domain-containing protein [Streptomyces sclerotialus]|uniref:PIN domain-containing protein n=1 Tax=Streptomyces sclerotialus TaxID=1957 RepID=UPI0006925607